MWKTKKNWVIENQVQSRNQQALSYNQSPMPTVLQSGPYRFYFCSHEPNEPPHVHVDRDELSAKFWLDPVALARNFGFNGRELTVLQQIVNSHRDSVIGGMEWVLWRCGPMSVSLR